MTSPTPIDVMLPFYGDVEHFKLAVQSVRAQERVPWRLVVVDDGYPSNEPERWLADLADTRITYLRNTRNLGVAGNFTRCVGMVESDYFVMMGGDDLMDPGYLEHVTRSVAAYPDADLVQPAVSVIDENGDPSFPLADRVKKLIRPRVDGNGAVLQGRHMAESLARGDWAYFPSILWKSDTVKRIGFRTEYEIALDLGLLFDIALADGSMLVTNASVFSYRRHASSASSETAGSGVRFEQERRFFAGFVREFQDRGWHGAARWVRCRPLARLHVAQTAVAAFLAGHPRASARLFGYVLR